MMKENLVLVDVLIELLDARIPFSSKNPDIDELAKNKKRIIVLNKADLASESANAAWKAFYEKKDFAVAAVNSNSGKGLNEVAELARKLMSEKIARQKARGRLMVPIRAMVVGIPNVGKSTMINRYAGKNMAKVADKPGVTRGKQWITISADFELLDTPGILWPKFEETGGGGNLNQGINLALTGAISDNVVDAEKLALSLLEFMSINAPQGLVNRYKIELCEGNDNAENLLHKIGGARGFKTKDGGIDLLRTAIILIDEFRAGKLGRITLEKPVLA
jgi:ribosome biogenesis GTPase A